jgi:hypothetical protein
MQALRLPLRIVFYREDGDWIAHCLEFDLAGDGPTKDAALASLSAAIRIQVDESLKSGNLDNLFMPAEGKYFRMFATGNDAAALELAMDALPFDAQRTEFREYSEAESQELATAK